MGKNQKIYSWFWTEQQSTSHQQTNDIYFQNIFRYKPIFKRDPNHKIQTIYEYNHDAQMIRKINIEKNNKEYYYIYNVAGQLLAKYHIINLTNHNLKHEWARKMPSLRED